MPPFRQHVSICTQELLQIAEAVSDRDDTLGVLVYGSYASGSYQSDSDLDLICITRSSQPKQFRRFVNGREVDVHANSRVQITKIFYTDFGDNNNFVLHAFVRGQPLIDPDGDVAELIREAHRIWEQGPPNPLQEVRQKIAANHRIIIAAAGRLTARSARSPQWCEVVQLLSGRFFLDCFYQYCRVHRLWSSGIWEMLTWTDPRYEELLTITRKYLNDPSLETRVQAIRQMAEATVIACGSNRETVLRNGKMQSD
jgi:predicted nucleotidyltransferase